MPNVSVIMAVYNGERYLAQAVESILAQTYRDFEFIIIDDGSIDCSPDIIEEYAARDSRIRLISRANRGLTRTLNEGLSVASGTLVARMDADDVSLPTRFEKQVAYLDANPRCVCVGSQVQRIDPYGSVIDRPRHKLTHDEIDADLLKGIGWSIVHPAAMMRRDAVMQVGGYREQFKTSQDLDLFLRLAEVGELANLPDVLLNYRQHFESVASTKADEQWRVKSVIVGDAYRRRGMTPPAQWPFERRVPPPADEQLRRWAWAALKQGNVPIARRHAAAAMRRSPLSPESWRVMYCALRGR
jgi:glycosyltransferase involved in cell wall biosynthesis